MADHLEERLRRIQEDFIRALPARIDEFASVWDSAEAPAALLKRAHVLAHRLAGGAGTLGQAELGQASKALELDIQALLEGAGDLDADLRSRFRDRTRGLLSCIQGLP